MYRRKNLIMQHVKRNNYQFQVEMLVDQKVSLHLKKDESTNLITKFISKIDIAIYYIDYNDTNLPNSLYAKLMYSIHHEMVLHLIDFMYRRTGDLLFNIAEVKRHKADIIDVMAKI